MQSRNSSPSSPVHESSDYLSLVIEWDALVEDLARGTTGALPTDMPTKNSDWMIDEASKDSFPPSDPPAWTSSDAGAIEDISGESEPTKRSYRTPVLIGVIGLFALTGILAGISWLRRR